MKDHPHLRGAAESYNSLKEAFLPLLHLSRMMGAIAARASLHFCFHWWLIICTHRHRIKITLICLFLFCIPCKKTSIPRCNEDEIQMGKSQMTQPPCSSVNLTESEKSSGLRQAACLLWKQNLLSLHEQKDMFAKKCCIDFDVNRLAKCDCVGFLAH